jgi:hypothetical protein
MDTAGHAETVTGLLMEVRERQLRLELLHRDGAPGAEIASAALWLHDMRPVLAYLEYKEAELEAARLQGRDEGFGNGVAKGFRMGYQARVNEELAAAEPAQDGVVVPLRAVAG